MMIVRSVSPKQEKEGETNGRQEAAHEIEVSSAQLHTKLRKPLNLLKACELLTRTCSIVRTNQAPLHEAVDEIAARAKRPQGIEVENRMFRRQSKPSLSRQKEIEAGQESASVNENGRILRRHQDARTSALADATDISATKNLTGGDFCPPCMLVEHHHNEHSF